MIFMAPDVYITEYIKATGQLKPEILAKAEMLMVTGYQRELTYRHNDGSFSAFGESDPSGSLWLTAFVLKVFAQAKGLIYIDDNVLNMAREWFVFHQNQDGSFDPVGFICHNEMVGGINGQKNSLTAFTAIALLEAGEKTGSAKAIAYLETKLAEIDDAYTMSMVSYALELGQSSLRTEAYRRLINMAQEDENGLHWSLASGEIEATSYALLALLAHGDKMTAGQAAKWLVSKRNALGGFSSTQDTVMALEALTQYSKEVKANVDDLTIGIKNESGVEQEISIKQVNFDVLQMVELPVNEQVEIKVLGTGEAVLQLVKRFNLPEPQQLGQAFEINVLYDTTEVPVKAKGAASEAYSYYNPEMKGETLGQDMVVQE